MKLLNTTR